MSRGRTRSRLLAWLLVTASSLLVARLFELQVLGRRAWRDQRELNLRGRQWLPSRRGRILDRSGNVLAADEPQFALELRYRNLRREHGIALLLHTDHLLRAIRRERGVVTPLLVRGEPLRYSDPPDRFAAAAAGLCELPAGWVHDAGPLDRRLRGILRFYVFALLGKAFPSWPRLGVEFKRRWAAPPELSVGGAVAALLGVAAERVRVAVVDAARRARASLDELAGLLGTDLRLRGRVTFVGEQVRSERGGLLDWLDALDAWLDAETDRQLARAQREARARAAARTGGLLGWLERSFGLAPDVTTAQPSFEARLDRRFLVGHRSFEVLTPVPFDSVVELVVGRREAYPGFEVSERMRRRYPVLERGRRPFRCLGVVAERDAKAVERPIALLPLPDELDKAVDVKHSLHVADTEWLRWKESLDRSERRRRRIARGGVEAALDSVLRGDDGLRDVRRDRRGREQLSPRYVASQAGLDVRLTLDAELQNLALDVLEHAGSRFVEAGDVAASLVLIDAESGAIRAMASLPETLRLADGRVQPDRRNRAARRFHVPYPGSIVKPVIGYEGLAEGVVAPHTTYEPCHGAVVVGRTRLSCGCRARARSIDVTAAIEYSCNGWFAHLGLGLGAGGIDRALARFGLLQENDRHAPFGLDVQRPRHVPGERWSVMHRAVGYGYEIAPLWIARAYAGLATGRLPELRWVEAIDGRETDRVPATDLRLDPTSIAVIRDALARVVGPHGTARKAGLRGAPIASKTGTAEVHVRGVKGNNCWFAGYVPLDRPRYAFCCVFWEMPNKVHGGDVAAPAVADLIHGMAANPALAARYPEVSVR